jgi:dihydroorotate dehydrogenase electron transfer subunit
MTAFLLPEPLRVADIRPENPQTKTIVLEGRLAAEPGQFVMAWLPGLPDKPFSLLDADPITLTVAAVGPVSRALHTLRSGDMLWLRGPLGRGYTLPASAQKILLVGGGYGVAPLLFLARRALAGGHTVQMIIGAKTAAQLLLVNAARRLGIAVTVTTEDGSAGLKGLVTAAMPPALAEAGAVYACGPTGMLRAVAQAATGAGLPVQVGWEAVMRCGLGLCGSCEVGNGWLTCLDGPVFGNDELGMVND